MSQDGRVLVAQSNLRVKSRHFARIYDAVFPAPAGGRSIACCAS